MSTQANFTHMVAEIKKSCFLPTIIFGIALSLTFHQEVLTKIFPLESLRLKLTSYAAIIFFVAICFYFFQFIVPKRLLSLEKSQKLWIFLLSALTPFILAIATLSENYLNKTIYFLMPEHTVQIEGLHKNTTLNSIYTKAQGYISFDTLELQGWERKGDAIMLVNTTNNRIVWRGKTGDKLILKFGSGVATDEIRIYWDSLEKNYSLFSDSAEGVLIAKKFDVPLYTSWMLLAIAAYFSAVFVTFSLSLVLITLPGFAPPSWHNKNAWIIFALPMYITWSLYLLVFWPGFMSRDSMGIWEQVMTENFVHNSPVGHTLTIWLITRLWSSPAAVGLAQIIILGSILGWGIATMRQFGAPNWLAWMTSIALAVSPANSALSITLWKDILFSTVVVALSILFFKIVATNGKWLTKKMAWFWLGIAATLISLYGRNGFFVSFVSMVFITLIYREHWKPLLKSASLFLAIYFTFTGPIYQVLDVELPNVSRQSPIATQIIAGHMNAGTFISAEDKKILMSVLNEYPWPYNCYRNDDFFYRSPINTDYIQKHSRELMSIALRVTQEAPLVTLGHFACQGASVYRIPQEFPNEMNKLSIFPNEYGIRTSSWLPGIYPLLLKFLNDITRAPIIWFIWRMPFWMYLCVFSCGIFCARNKNWKPLLILIPGLATVFPYLILTLGQIFRYVYSMYLIGILLSGYFLTSALRNSKQ